MRRKNREAKTYTPDQVAAKQDKAVRFLRDVVGNDDRADDIEDMSLSEYAEHKRIQMAQNRRQKGVGSRQKMRSSIGNRQSKIGNPKCRQYRDRCVPMKDFAFVGDPTRSTTYKLRLDDAPHTRAAMARFSRTRIPKQDRRRVAEQILRAARRFGIDSSRFAAKYAGNPNGDGNGAAEMYTTFHGREPREVIEYETGLERDRDLAALGDLIELDLPAIKKTINFARDGVVLCANPEGTQMFAVGGNQDLSAALDLADDPAKEFIDFGPIKTITYRTRKSFDRFQTTDYVHELGEEGGEKPRLVYCVPAKHILFVGGEYRIAAPEADGVSPGIVN
jgi:hypothetical protein